MPEELPDDPPVGPLDEPPDFPVELVLVDDAPDAPLDDDFASLDLSPFDDPSPDALAPEPPELPEPPDSRDAASDLALDSAPLEDESLDDVSFDDAPLGPLLR